MIVNGNATAAAKEFHNQSMDCEDTIREKCRHHCRTFNSVESIYSQSTYFAHLSVELKNL